MKQKILFFLFLLFFSSGVLGNGVGNYQKKEVSDYIFEFGIDPQQPVARQKTAMSVSVHEKQTDNVVEAENFWIRISNGEEIIFSSTDLKTKKTGPIIFIFAFPEHGVYTLDFGFDSSKGKISAGFGVGVTASIANNEKKFHQFISASIAVLMLGFVIGVIAKKFWKK